MRARASNVIYRYIATDSRPGHVSVHDERGWLVRHCPSLVVEIRLQARELPPALLYRRAA